jgi:ribosomal protein S26
VSVVDASLARELRKMGTFIPRVKTMKYMCVSCAIHNRVVRVRARAQRRYGPGEFT